MVNRAKVTTILLMLLLVVGVFAFIPSFGEAASAENSSPIEESFVVLSLDGKYSEEQLRATDYSGSIAWVSFNQEVATVNQYGLLTAVGKGECMVKAFSEDEQTLAVVAVKVCGGDVYKHVSQEYDFVYDAIIFSDGDLELPKDATLELTKGRGDEVYGKTDGGADYLTMLSEATYGVDEVSYAYSIWFKSNGERVEPNGEFQIALLISDGLKSDYHVYQTVSSEVSKLSGTEKGGYYVFKTNKPSSFAILTQKVANNTSNGEKSINVGKVIGIAVGIIAGTLVIAFLWGFVMYRRGEPAVMPLGVIYSKFDGKFKRRDGKRKGGPIKRLVNRIRGKKDTQDYYEGPQFDAENEMPVDEDSDDPNGNKF